MAASVPATSESGNIKRTPRRSTVALAVCVTPFDRKGALDLISLQRHVERIVDAGLGVCVGGSGTEEGFALSKDERRAVVDTAVAAAAGRVEVRLNALEPRTPDEMVSELQLAHEAGCDRIHVPILDPGHGFRPSPDELIAYLAVICREAKTPVVISTSAAMGPLMPIDVLRRAAAEWGITGIVCGTPELAYVAQAMKHVGDLAEVYVASFPQLLNALTLGGAGFLSPEANVAPELCGRLLRSWDACQYTEALDTAGPLLRLSAIILSHGVTATVKALLRGLGLLDAYCRPPRLELHDSVADQLTMEVGTILALEVAK